MDHAAEHNIDRIHDRFRRISEHSRWKSLSKTMLIASRYTSSTAFRNTNLPKWITETLTRYRYDNLKVYHKDRSNTANVCIVSANRGTLLSFTTADNLGSLHIIRKITSRASTAQIVSNMPEVFKEGIGNVSRQPVKLHIHPVVIPNQHRLRRSPFRFLEDIKKELERLERLDIIEKVNVPTPWVSPFVAVPNNQTEYYYKKRL